MAENTFNQFLKSHIKVTGQDEQKMLEEALTADGRKMEHLLIASQLIGEKDLASLKSDYFHIPYIAVDKIEVEEAARDLMPASTVRAYRTIPFSKSGNVVKIAIADPTNLQVLEALEFLAKKNDWEVQLYLVTETDMDTLLQKNIGVAAEVSQALKEFTADETDRAKTKTAAGSGNFKIEEKAPVTKIIDGLVSQALSQRASDIHIEPLERESRVRFRIDGIMKSVFSFPINAHAALVSRIKILADLKIDEQRLPQDGRFTFYADRQDIDFRVSTFPTTYGEKVVLRALAKAQQIPSFEELGLTGQRQAALKKAISIPHGMLLVTGPTGSGKSTTLFVALTQLNKPGVNIVTLEDPVEYILPGANQAQVNPEIGFTFASGLRSILRQDPNIILVGEIRDKETAELAVHSSLTGHLVFSTLHTNDAIGAIPRIIDMGVEPFLLVASINIIMAQRLVRTLCPDCKKETQVTKEVLELITRELEGVPKAELEGVGMDKPKIFTSVGCKKCNNTGYKGRIGIYEAVEITKEMSELILAKAAPHKLQETARVQGMVTVRQDGFIKVLSGATTIEEVLRETSQ